MREKILAIIEKNSRIDLKDLAALLGESEAAVANEIAEMEKENMGLCFGSSPASMAKRLWPISCRAITSARISS